MPTRVYDSSLITKRAGQKAIAGSFINRLNPPNGTPQQSFGLVSGVYDNSIMNAVKTGQMTQYTRYPTCVAISTGCPCPITNSIVIPGAVSNITFTVGSIIVSWIPPTVGNRPLKYRVTPYVNDIAQPSVITSQTSYKFENLTEWQPYSFTVCAINEEGQGPTVPSSYFIAPPDQLSKIMSGQNISTDPAPSLKYVINAGLDSMLKYIASINLGPTRGSRYIYVWITSIVEAWNWVRSESRITGIHDNWNWSSNKASNPLSDSDSIIWLCTVIDYITPFFIPSGYYSIYNCPADTVTRIKREGEWDNWLSNWQTWYNYRQTDGFINASTAQPTNSANWGQTIIVDGVTINNISEFPEPRQWTRLTVQGKKQNYLTYTWDNVISSCLTELNEQSIQNSVEPASGLARDTEIDEVRNIAANLSDEQKIIAEFWAGGPGTVSPPLMFIWMWKEYIRIIPISCPNIMFSLLDLAIHLFEGGRITWRLKAAHMEDRPIQEIRRRYTGQSIQSWNGLIDGSQWTPYQESNFITPPFADFPSGHSHFSKAFALTMNKWFSENIQKLNTTYDNQYFISPLFKTNQTVNYGNFIISSGSSIIQPGVIPNSSITLSFNKWNEIADQAGLSRLYGGIHAISAHNSSQQVAIDVDTIINDTWNIQHI